MNDDDLFKLLVQLKMRVDDNEREKKTMNIAQEVYITYRRIETIGGQIIDDKYLYAITIDSETPPHKFISEYDGVFVSERDATLHLEETYGKNWYAQGYRKLKQYIAKY